MKRISEFTMGPSRWNDFVIGCIGLAMVLLLFLVISVLVGSGEVSL